MVDLISQNQPSSLDAFIINFQTWVQFIVRTLPLKIINKGEVLSCQNMVFHYTALRKKLFVVENIAELNFKNMILLSKMQNKKLQMSTFLLKLGGRAKDCNLVTLSSYCFAYIHCVK